MPIADENTLPHNYVWHPECHLHFQEDCSIYFLQLREQFTSGIDDIFSRITNSCIKSFRIYPLFGQYDYAVIAWGRPQKHEFLLKSLRHSSAIYGVRRAVVANIIDVGHVPAHELNRRRLEDISKFYEAPDYAPSIKDFIENGLIYSYLEPSPGSQLFRFFVTVTHGASVRTGASVSASTLILDAVRKMVSEHEGVLARFYDCAANERDDFDFIIEVTSERFYEIYSYLEKLALSWRDFKMRSSTSIVASTSTVIQEAIDTEWNELNPDHFQFFEFLNYGAAMQDFSKLEYHNKGIVFDLYKKFRNRLKQSEESIPIGGYMRDLFVARVARSYRHLVSGLSVLHELEGHFVFVARKLWITKLGQSWYVDVQAIAESIGLNKGFDPKKSTLDNAISISNKIESVRDELVRIIGSDWFIRAKSIVSLRNAYSHGEIALDEMYLESKWQEMATTIFEVGELFNKIVLWSDSLRTPGLGTQFTAADTFSTAQEPEENKPTEE